MKKNFMSPELRIKRFSANIVTDASGLTLNVAEKNVMTSLETQTGSEVSGRYIINLKKVGNTQ